MTLGHFARGKFCELARKFSKISSLIKVLVLIKQIKVCYSQSSFQFFQVTLYSYSWNNSVIVSNCLRLDPHHVTKELYQAYKNAQSSVSPNRAPMLSKLLENNNATSTVSTTLTTVSKHSQVRIAQYTNLLSDNITLSYLNLMACCILLYSQPFVTSQLKLLSICGSGFLYVCIYLLFTLTLLKHYLCLFCHFELERFLIFCHV